MRKQRDSGWTGQVLKLINEDLKSALTELATEIKQALTSKIIRIKFNQLIDSEDDRFHKN